MSKWLLVLFLLFFNGVLFAKEQQYIETIQLNHRLANEVLNEVQAFLPKQATARAFNDFIILQADPHTIKQIKQLVNKLDTPVQRLNITVVRTDQSLATDDGGYISGQVSTEKGELAGRVSVQKWSTQTAKNKDQYFQAQGIANTPVAIHLGKAIPQQQQYLVLRADGDLAVQNTTQYINIKNGFNAIARILPNHQVIVEIHPRFADFSKQTGTVEKSSLVSTITGTEGDWLLIGEINDGKNIDHSGVTRYHSHKKLQQKIYIKVEQIL